MSEFQILVVGAGMGVALLVSALYILVAGYGRSAGV